MSLPPDPLVRSAVRAAPTAPAEACPDAEVLGLYAEGDLGTAERLELETHLAACDRCQATLAAFVRAAPEVESAGPVRDGFLAWFMGWRWLVPVASVAAVAVVAVWIGQGPSNEVARMEPAIVAPTPRTADSTAFGPAAPREGASMDVRQLPAQEVAPPPARRVQPPAAQKRLVTPPAEPEPQPTSPTPPPSAPASAPAPPPPAAVAVPPAPAAATPAMRADVPATEERQTLGAVAGMRDAAVADEKARSRETPSARPEARRENAAAASANFRVQTADSWRVQDGRVERSLDRGRTWRRAATPGGTRIIAIAPVSATVCWAIASDAVLRTADGTTWTSLRIPSSEALTGIVVVDPVTATVTTAAGAAWTTSDGGATWRRP